MQPRPEPPPARRESISVTIYSRDGCHLCEEVRAQLETLRREHGFVLIELDIDADAALKKSYDHEVPVVMIDGREAFRHRWSPRLFLQQLRGEG
ncbi:MAG: glutaredoxin family protein [Acidobacteria bacterium]|nr:glutaredoxin family protein [Acidobacteriota bacterium]